MSGMKFDDGKLRWSLLRGTMTRALEGVLSVLEFGAKKYAKDSWLTVPDAKTRYRDALDRHLAAIDKGEEVDSESGQPHLFHVACNALFLAELGCRGQTVTPQHDSMLLRGGMSNGQWAETIRELLYHLDMGVDVTLWRDNGTPTKYTVRVLRNNLNYVYGTNKITWKE